MRRYFFTTERSHKCAFRPEIAYSLLNGANEIIWYILTMAMHLDLMKGMLYTVSDLKIEGTNFSKVLWQGLLLRCGRAAELWDEIEEDGGTICLEYSLSRNFIDYLEWHCQAVLTVSVQFVQDHQHLMFRCLLS